MHDRHGTDGGAQRGDIAEAAAFADEPPPGLQGAEHAGRHRRLIGHPVQRGVGEHCIELGGEIERLPVELAHIEPAFA